LACEAVAETRPPLFYLPVTALFLLHLFWWVSESTMPLYEYQCLRCGKTFELLRRISDADADLQCPDCHSQQIERQFSTFSAGGCSSSPSGGFT
jgi:putative FmdB family regulatory protein